MLAASGEDAIAVSDADDFAANVELAAALPPAAPRPPPARAAAARRNPWCAHHRAAQRAAAGPGRALSEDADRRGQRRHGRVALLLRGDHELNAVKAQKLPGRRQPAAHGQRRRGAGRDRLRRPAPSARWGSRAAGAMPTTPRSRWPILSAAPTRRTCICTGVNWGRDLPEAPAAPICATSSPATPVPPGTGSAAHRARHRGRAYLSARQQVQRRDECDGARRGGQRGADADGLLWHWCDAHRSGRDRAESR